MNNFNKVKTMILLFIVLLSFVGCKNVTTEPKEILNERTTREQVEEATKSVTEEAAKTLKGIGKIVVKETDKALDDQTKEDLVNLREKSKGKAAELLNKYELKEIGGILSNKTKEAIHEIQVNQVNDSPPNVNLEQ